MSSLLEPIYENGGTFIERRLIMAKQKKGLPSPQKERQIKAVIYVSLPVPNKDVIEFLQDDGSQHRYFEAIERIAKLESETLIKVASKKYGVMWKLMLILAIFMFLILALMMSDKLTFQWSDKAFQTQRTAPIPRK